MHLAALIKQKSYERIVHVLRHHWITFLPHIGLYLILSAIPVILFLLMNNIFPTLFEGDIVFALTILFGSMYYLGLQVFFYTQFVEFYLDITIITNDRAIDVEQLGLFSRSISELDLFRIQDVSTEIHGAFATLFNYGDVVIKTASTNVNIVGSDVPHPNKIREDLIRLAHEDRKYHYAQPTQPDDVND